jgi:hypothetical protein
MVNNIKIVDNSQVIHNVGEKYTALALLQLGC